MIGLDLDRTLISGYGAPELRFNESVLAALLARGERMCHIYTNQGGLPFGVMGATRADGRPYPTPAQFVERFRFARHVLCESGIRVTALSVSVYHPTAPASAIQRAARQVRELVRYYPDWIVYTTPQARKPAPLMLRRCTEYWGDSPEDERAAQAAGVLFVRVERFM